MNTNYQSQDRLPKLCSKSFIFPLIKSVMITIKYYWQLLYIVANRSDRYTVLNATMVVVVDFWWNQIIRMVSICKLTRMRSRQALLTEKKKHIQSNIYLKIINEKVSKVFVIWRDLRYTTPCTVNWCKKSQGCRISFELLHGLSEFRCQ